MLLSIDTAKLVVVNERMFKWFVKSLAQPSQQEYANATAWYQDGTMVAVKANGKFYVKTK